MPFQIGHKITSGSKHWMWDGGRYKDADGYVMVYSPHHPNKNIKGYVCEHRLKMEIKVGRFINKNEIVHYINEVKDDNRIENLKLFKNQSEHLKEHHATGSY